LDLNIIERIKEKDKQSAQDKLILIFNYLVKIYEGRTEKEPNIHKVTLHNICRNADDKREWKDTDIKKIIEFMKKIECISEERTATQTVLFITEKGLKWYKRFSAEDSSFYLFGL
jgi:hypothetical protein